jgi:hypothetical protein
LPASLPASLSASSASLQSGALAPASVCWQHVGSIVKATDKKQVSYQCRKQTKCEHLHIDSAEFLALSKDAKIKRFEEWKVPATMKADFVKALK